MPRLYAVVCFGKFPSYFGGTLWNYKKLAERTNLFVFS